MKRWVQMFDNKDNDLTVFNQNKLPGRSHNLVFESVQLIYLIKKKKSSMASLVETYT